MKQRLTRVHDSLIGVETFDPHVRHKIRLPRQRQAAVARKVRFGENHPERENTNLKGQAATSL